MVERDGEQPPPAPRHLGGEQGVAEPAGEGAPRLAPVEDPGAVVVRGGGRDEPRVRCLGGEDAPRADAPGPSAPDPSVAAEGGRDREPVGGGRLGEDGKGVQMRFEDAGHGQVDLRDPGQQGPPPGRGTRPGQRDVRPDVRGQAQRGPDVSRAASGPGDRGVEWV